MSNPTHPVIRTRFAPSPTGYLHVGGIRTALFAYLVARQAGGKFILRFEDTDKRREVEGSREHLIESLRSLDIDYDEGPDIGGGNGPYVQSDRLDIYRRWAQKLIDDGRAYADPYTSEEVQAFREKAQASKRAFLYRDHRPENLEQLAREWDGSTPLRFKSEPKNYTFHDQVMGDISTGPEVIDDFILIKSDGYPTYNFAHIVDDAEMGITHVIRGQEFISSMPNYLNLYEALGYDLAQTGGARRGSTHVEPSRDDGADRATGPVSSDLRGNFGEISDDGSESIDYAVDSAASSSTTSQRPSNTEDSAFPAELGQDKGNLRPSGSEVVGGSELVGGNILQLPVFAHLPHIMNEQGNKKLGKRDGAKDVLDYLRDGYLPEALVSFIATLGWNDGSEQEIFSASDLIEKFSLDRVQRSGARFDEKRLLWMNGQFIRQLPLDDLMSRVESFWSDAAGAAEESQRRDVLALAQDRLKTLRDLPALTSYFFEEPRPAIELISSNKQLKKLSADETTELISTVRDALASLDTWEPDAIQAALNQLLESTGQKPGTLFSLVRVVTTWAPFSPELDKSLALLGRDTTLRRLDESLATIQNVS